MNERASIAGMVAAGLTAVRQQQIDQARELLKQTLAWIERDPDNFDRKAKADAPNWRCRSVEHRESLNENENEPLLQLR